MTYTLRLTNTGNVADTFALSVTGDVWTTTAPSSIGPLAASASTNLEISVQIPAGTNLDQRDTVTITVASLGDPAQWANAVLTTTAVIPTYGVVVEPPTDARSGLMGASTTYTLRVTNTGNVQDSFTIAVSGNNWTTIVPTSVGPLAADKGADVQVTVQILGSMNDGDKDTATLTVTSLGNPSVSSSSVLTTTAIVASYGIETTPPAATRSGKPGATVTHTLTLQNLGTAQDTFAVSLSAHTWNTVASTGTVGPLAANATSTLEIYVGIPLTPFQRPPGTASNDLSDTVSVTLTSSSDVNESDSSTLTTTAVWPGVYLPLILVNFSHQP